MIGASIYAHSRISVLLIAIGMLTWAVSPAFGLEIKVQQKASVKGETVKLGDIAEFDPSDDSRVSLLKGIEISSSPAPGANSMIGKGQIISRVNPYISGERDILVRMPERMTVSRSAQMVSARYMEQIFMEYIKDNSSWPEDRIGFETINTPGAVALPEGSLSWDVQNKGKMDFIGNVTLTIDFRVDQKTVKKVIVSGRVGVRADTIRAAGKIDRGKIISDGDIEEISEGSFNYRKDLLISREDVVGKRALRTIQAGQIILDGMFENPPPVKKGDRVIISAENSQLKITATGEALQDGHVGDRVEVLNIQSGKKILATVSGSGVVEVIF